MLKLSANTRTRRSSYKRPDKQGRGAGVVRFVRNVVLSIAALGALIVGAGVAYIWYMGEHAPPVQTATSQTVNNSAPVLKTPPQPRADAKVSAAIQMLTTPITPGSNASVTIRTNPKARCTITAEYNKIPIKDSGLQPKTADEYGMATWSWTVKADTPIGTWPVKITCANTKNSAFVQGDQKVVKTLPAEQQ